MRSNDTSGRLDITRVMDEGATTPVVADINAMLCSKVNQVMQELTGVNYNTVEQNNDMSKARQARDWKDTL